MFNTIKSKMILISTAMLLILSIVLGLFTFLYYKHTKAIILKAGSVTISVFAQEVNKNIIKMENNARDLALIGEIYKNHTQEKERIDENAIRLFENYPESLGGGIWYKPYYLQDVEFNCVYVYRNKQNKLVVDDNFETIKYNYPKRSWYKELISQLEKEDGRVVWSKPYFEAEGSHTIMVTAGYGVYDDDNNSKLIGLSTVDWELTDIVDKVQKMRPTQNSFTLFADKTHDYIIVSTDTFLDNPDLMGKSLKEIPWYSENLKKLTYFTYHNKKYIPYYKTLDNGMIFIVCIPRDEIFALVYRYTFMCLLLVSIISFSISIILLLFLNKSIKRPIDKLIEIANKIGDGDINREIRIEKPQEFKTLAKTFNKMKKDITLISKERATIEQELSIAKDIQKSCLPCVFPPFPERSDFEIYATMDAAKNVGGDFYDFYLLEDGKKLMFLIADVSGKGVPAALFMMTMKTKMADIALADFTPDEMMKEINNQTCENNKQGFFVTMFVGVVDFEKNKVTCVNCGHNPPLARHKVDDFNYINMDTNLVLGALPNVDYKIYEYELQQGDVIFLYTDGVTEAMNEEGKLYGEDRLKEIINKSKDKKIEEIVQDIKEDIQIYSKNVAQSDDITMLIFKYNGKTKNYKSVASKENYHNFLSWLEEKCMNNQVTPDLQTKIELCSEEIYTNVFSYAYGEEQGEIEVEFEKNENEIIMRFIDYGIPYNPLEKDDPDISLDANERSIGGLGIFMVKQMTKSVEYNYENKNILTLKF